MEATLTVDHVGNGIWTWI